MSLGTNSTGIKKFIDAIEADARALIKEVNNLSVWGGSNPDSIWSMTYLEREVLTEVIKEKVDLLYGKNGIARAKL